MPSDADPIAAAYDRWSRVYDHDRNRTRDLAGDVLRCTFAGSGFGDVVEFGCGTGRNTAWLAERSRSLLALDFSAGMLREARARITAPAVGFLRHDLRTPWPVAAASADLVVGMLVCEHLEGLSPLFAEAARVMRAGARLFLCELHPLRQLLGRQAEFTDPDSGVLERVPAFHHDVADFVNGGLQAGLVLARLDEWRDTGAPQRTVPRLLSLEFRTGAGSG